LTHTIEVSQIARTISKALHLNEDLTEAIALGHDLGHAPFGHSGEEALNEVCPGGFKHNEQSLRVVNVLEKDGRGLNLTFEVQDGILKHSRGSTSLKVEDATSKPLTLEGSVVRIADSIAYVNHDIEDAIFAGIITIDDLPKEAINVLGKRYSARIDKMVRAVVEASLESDTIKMEEEVLGATDELRSYLYREVYPNKLIQKEANRGIRVIKELFWYYMENPKEVYEKLSFLPEDTSIERRICDFLAGLSDREALSKYEEVFLPKPWIMEL
jgi:dGTPase